MFLKAGTVAILLCVFWLGPASAEQSIPGLHKKTYKLKSFAKSLRGKKTETRTGRDRFCGEKIHPILKEEDGKLNLELNPGLGYEWRNIDENPAETGDGCRYPIQQKIESTADKSVLILLNIEECANSKSAVGSMRDTVQFNGAQIVYTSESVVKNRAGGWDVNEAKESFSCVWAAD